MSHVGRAPTLIPTASEYVLANFELTDRIAVLVLNRGCSETVERITTAKKAASSEFQAWLRDENANRSDLPSRME
jgi:lipocalin